MGAGPLVAEIIGTFCVAATLLYRYGDWRRHHLFVTVSVLIAWYFSLIIVFVLPMDVSRTAYNKCVRDHTPTPAPPTVQPANYTLSPALEDVNSSLSEPDNNLTVTSTGPLPCQVPWSYVSDDVMPHLWRVVYWSSQALTWLLLPIMQSYTQAGDFTVRGKLRTALVDNLVYYGTYLVIAVLLLIYLATRPDVTLDFPHLKTIAASASNTWGLLLLVLLLGYSLVELPRHLWRAAQRGFSLRHAYFRAAKLSAERSEAEETLDDLLDSLQLAADATSASHPLRRDVDTILRRVPTALQQRMRSRQRSGDAAPVPTQKSLIQLHRRVIAALECHHRTETQWTQLVEQVIELEDVAENQRHRDGIYKPSLPREPSWASALIGPRLEWYWKCWLRSYVLKCLAVVCALTSAMVIWSEVTFFNKSPTLSLFAVFANAAKSNYDYFALEAVSCVVIAYLCVCTYFTIIKIRVLNFYYLAPEHQTDQHSLIFSGMLLCRLTPPLCLNFLGMIHMDSHVIEDRIDETAYTQIMGHMDVLSILSDGFNIYFPMLVLAFSLATWFSLGARLLSLLGFQQFVDDDDEIAAELVEEGRELVRRERRRRRGREGRSAGAGDWGSQAYRAAKQRAERRLGELLPRSDSSDSARLVLLGSPDPPLHPPAPSQQRAEAWSDPDPDPDLNTFSYTPNTGRPSKGFFDDV